jgi:hypothetical protein
MVAAIGLTATGVVSAGRQSSDQAAVEGEILGGHPHGARAIALQRAADRRNARRCATATGLAADPARCPDPVRRLVREAQRRTLAQARRAARALPGIQGAFDAPTSGDLAQLAATGAPASQVGSWSAPVALNPDPDTGFVSENAIVLPTGKVLLFGPGPPVNENLARALVYDPATGATTRVDPPINPATGRPYNIWCAGQVLLENGTVLVAGGNDDIPNTPIFQGLRQVFTFNPYNLTWTTQPPMYTGRWYPTLTRLADGRVTILGGWDDEGTTNSYAQDLEVFTPNPTDRDGQGTIARYDDAGVNPGLYSQMALLPDGNVLRVGPRTFDPKILKQSNFKWNDLSEDDDERYWGAFAITIEGNQHLLRRIGGAGPVSGGKVATQTETGIFNLDDPAAGEQAGPALGIPRAHLNAVILPTGEILAVGGGFGQDATGNNYMGAVFQSELFSPATNSWRAVASQTNQRTYHSVAVLLPDGRVLSAGDDKPHQAGANLQIGSRGDDTVELYTPPNLLGGAPRPSIASLQREIDFGQPFTVQSAQAASITRAVLIAPGAVTHATDMNQRSIRLDIASVQGDTLTLTAPSSPNLATPGHYLLFLTDSAGVSSPGRWVALGTDIGPIIPDDGGLPSLTPPPASPPPAPGPGTGGGTTSTPVACLGRRATIVGTAGRDLIRGTAAADVIVSGAGADVIVGRGGADVICAGMGNDRVVAGLGNDRADGGPGADRLVGGPGADRLTGGAGKDLLVGGPGRNVLIGGRGKDICSGARQSHALGTCDVKRIAR